MNHRFVVVELLQGEVSSELGGRAAHNSNFDWIDALVGTKVDEVEPQSPGALRRSAADPCMQSENLLDLEMLGSFLFCTVTVRIMLPANVQGHVVLAIVKLDLALATDHLTRNQNQRAGLWGCLHRAEY